MFVRISCSFVTLQYCRTRKISGSQVLQICLCESLPICHCCKYVSQVWYLCFTESLRKYHVANMSRQCCKYVLLQVLPKCHCDRKTTPKSAKMSQLHKYHRPPPVENESDPPPVENDPSEGIRDHQWKMTLDPTEGIK